MDEASMKRNRRKELHWQAGRLILRNSAASRHGKSKTRALKELADDMKEIDGKVGLL